ncbi:MAG: serine/threonine protein kinase [Myxococcales bacterium]|nr:serine/threonine protein kinase [Myxococcales bacterium]
MVTPARPSYRPSRYRQVGTVVAGKYRVRRVLGVGGMGTVYKAENMTVGRTVALKLLHPHLADDGVALARFQREARVAASVDHPHVVEVLDLGIDELGAPYFVMEYVRGKSVAQVLAASGPMPWERASRIIGQVLAALHAVHLRGVVHRDLKPENVLLTTVDGREDFVKVLDFGIAAFVESVMESGASSELTPTGRTMTTPQYASPEQLLGGRGRDARVDVYAAGVLLYELLAAYRPFVADSLVALCELVTNAPPTPLRAFRRDVPPALEAVIHRALAKAPDDRWPTAQAMQEALVPFGAVLEAEVPEPTDTFTIDLRALLAREGDAPEPTQGHGVISPDVAAAIARQGELLGSGACVTACRARGLSWPPPSTGWIDDRYLDALEDVDRLLAAGDRRSIADAGRALGDRWLDQSPFTAPPEAFFATAPALWQRCFRDGGATVKAVGRGYGLVVITGHPRPSVARAIFFVGLLDRALTRVGARSVEVRLARSAALGDPRDEIETSWSV